MIDIEGLSYTYPLGEKIFENANFQMNKGDFSIILGKNGCGKSTLVNLLLGLRTPINGSIEFMGLDPIKDALEIRKKSFFISHSIELHEYASVDFYIDCMKVIYEKFDTSKAKDLLEIFELDSSKSFCQLSLGQSARAQIVAALSSNSEFILIDEITAVLDPLARRELAALLEQEISANRTILMATNIPTDTESEGSNVFRVKNHKLVDYEQSA